MTSIIALALTLLTGFSGLVYEVTWQKYLATLLGSHAEATAAVLGLFLGGLSVGYALFGSLTRRLVQRAHGIGRPPPLLLLYGIVEACIGIYALLFPWLFEAAQALSVRLALGSGGGGFAADVALSACLIGPPTVLMGGTIPVLTQGLARNIQQSTRIHSLVYGFNTGGAFLGALAAGFVLVPALGLIGVMRAMGLLNLAAGGVFVALGVSRRRTDESATAIETDAPETARPRRFAAYALIAWLSGAAMMVIQTVLNRLGGLSFGASHFTFSMVVAVFVLCIALGSFAVSTLKRIPPGLVVLSQWLLVALLLGLYFAVPEAPYWAASLRSLFPSTPEAFYAYYLTCFAALLLILVAPIALSGALLPLLFHLLRRETTDLGSVSGRLYSFNTFGSLVGALVGGYVAFFVLDAHHLYRVAVLALSGVAALLGLLLLDARGRAASAAGLAAVACVLALIPEWDPLRLHAGLFRSKTRVAVGQSTSPDDFFGRLTQRAQVRFHEDDPTASVAVIDSTMRGGGLNRSIISNGKPDGGTASDYQTMALAAILPALLTARPPERAFVIGLGTGVTVGELTVLPSMEEIVVAEISPAVIEAAPLFDSANHQASKSEKVRHLQQDAYRALLRSEGSFDLIVSEPSNPWVVGVEMLFSREFLAAARSRLRPGGVYLQWFHVYETDLASIELVLRTYLEVFDRVAIWFSMGADLLIVGLPDDRLPALEQIEARAELPAYRKALRRMEIPTVDRLLAHEVLPFGALRAELLPDEVHTLLHPILSHRAARAFYVGNRADVVTLVRSRTDGGEATYLERRVQQNRSWGPQQARSVRNEVCRYYPNDCEDLLQRWRALLEAAPPTRPR